MLVPPERSIPLLTPFKKKNRYYNHEHEQKRNVFFHSLAMFFKTWLKRKITDDRSTPKIFFTPSDLQSGAVSITWIGHSTFLITIDDVAILTDPIFGDASWLFQRIQPPGIALHRIPPLDYVLLSHNHRDHMDATSLMHLKAHNPTVLVPHGDKQWFDKRSFATVHEFGWWQKYECPKNPALAFYFLPAYHWSQRTLFDRNRSLWGSWLIEYKGYRIYFAGDTAQWHHFGQIAHVFPSIDIALLPIGPCEPRAWMQYSHINAAQAGEAFLTLRARHFIPMHWGTFYFGLDEVHTPLEQLHAWWHTAHHNLEHAHLHIPRVGQKLFFQMPHETASVQTTISYQQL